MSEIQKCCQCLSQFSIEKLPRKLPNCSHSVCQKCIDQLIQTKSQILICGFCESTLKAKYFDQLETNIHLLLKLPITQQKSPILLNLKPDNDEIILTQTEPLTYSGQYCQHHNKPNDIVCISDKIKICSHCALFGAHKHHHFTRLQDFASHTSHKHAKMKELKEIVAKTPVKNSFNIEQFIKLNLNIKKEHLKIQIQKQFQKLLLNLKSKKQNLLKKLQIVYESLFETCKNNEQYEMYGLKIKQFEKFEQQLKSKLKKINKNNLTLPQKIQCFYTKDFESKFSDERVIVDLNSHYEAYRGKIKEILNNVTIESSQHLMNQLDDIIKIQNMNKFKGSVILHKSQSQSLTDLSVFSARKSSSKEHTDAGTQGKKQTIQTQPNLNRYKTPKRSLKSPSHADDEKTTKTNMTQSTLPLKKTGSPRNFNDYKVKMTQSHIATNTTNTRSPAKTPASKSPAVKDLQSSQITIKKSQNVQKTQTIYIQFTKNKLTDTFDISECELSSDTIVQYVHRARRMHKIRTLKLANNYLNPYGFEKLIQYLQGVSFINLVNNKLDQSVIDIIFRCRHSLQSVKIINLSNNPIHLDNKRMAKIQQIKKGGIVIIL